MKAITKSLDLPAALREVFLHLVMGSAVRIRHCPATVCAENLSNMPLGRSPFAPDVGVNGREDPGRRFRFGEA